MSSINKEEYLKRYLSGNNETNVKQKKKKRKVKPTHNIVKSRMRIFDDDIDVTALVPDNVGNTLDDDIGDNNPTVAEVVDERPEHVKQLEKYRQDSRWKLMASSDKDDADQSKTSLPEVLNAKSNNRGGRHDSDSDEPSIRKNPPHSSKLSKRHDSDSDATPDRKNKRHDSDSDTSPVRKSKRHDSDSDVSPVRQSRRHDSDFDASPVRKSKRHDSDSDQSPLRTQNRHESDSDQSPVRTSKRHFSDSDHSPARRNRREQSDSDQSPIRKSKNNHSDSDKSPVRKHSKTASSDSDQSPARRQRNRQSDSDQSPVRTQKRKSRFEPSSKEIVKHSKRCDGNNQDKNKMVKTLSGAKAGLSTAKMLREETNILKKKEKERFEQIGDEKLGRYAKTVVRDKRGKRRGEEEENAEKAKREAEKAKKYEQWGKGVAQSAQQEQNVVEAMHEMSKPLARYKDDVDRDEYLKEQDREGDPMLAFLTKKKKVPTATLR